jgi:asparagine synthetase B (glutamine-hydrolysing)
MCGILLVQSKDTLDINQHLAALKVLESRGPDYTRYEYRNNIFIAQAVLHITGPENFTTKNGKTFWPTMARFTTNVGLDIPITMMLNWCIQQLKTA